MKLTAEDIERLTAKEPPATDTVVLAHQNVRSAIAVAMIALNEILPDGREAMMALTKLEESYMWANAAIARTQPGAAIAHAIPAAQMPTT